MHATVRSVIEVSGEGPADVTILDTEASPEHLSRGTAMHADAMLVVVEPYFKSLETGRRMAALGVDLGLPRVALLANKVRDERDLAAVRQFAEQHDLDLVGTIPFDPALNEAEIAGVAPFDHDPQSPMVQAVARLAARLPA
jgi:CO dehydrogenase maturation factor